MAELLGKLSNISLNLSRLGNLFPVTRYHFFLISESGDTKSNSLSVSPLPLMEGPCFLCKANSSTRCNTCRPDVWFCCNEHEALHRDPYLSPSSLKV